MTVEEFNYVYLDVSVDDFILKEELETFKKTVSKFDNETPYYVYALCNLDGSPFYIGKGKNLRAYQHIKNAKNNSKSNIKNINHIKLFLKENSYPIIYIMDGNLSSKDAIKIEAEYIKYYGRIGFNDGGILTNVMPNSIQFGNDEAILISSYAGKIGGKVTKQNKSGIFSLSYDRSAELKRRWNLGILSQPSFIGYDRKIGGLASVKSKRGIHAEDYNHSQMSKKNWLEMNEITRQKQIKMLQDNSKLAGLKSKELGTNFTTWDSDKHKKACKLGGKIAGKIPMWTNGILNKRSHEPPDDTYFRGITKKHRITKELITYKYKIKETNNE